MFTPLDDIIELYRLNKGFTTNTVMEIANELINSVLPHGAGIDSEWVIRHKKDLKFVCYNSYHVMDDVGNYCGYVGFKIKFNANKMTFDVRVNHDDIAIIEKEYENVLDDEYVGPDLDNLEDYLYDTVKDSIEYYFLSHALKVGAERDLLNYIVSDALKEDNLESKDLVSDELVSNIMEKILDENGIGFETETKPTLPGTNKTVDEVISELSPERQAKILQRLSDMLIEIEK